LKATAGQPAAAEADSGDNAHPLSFAELLRTHQAMVFSIALHFLHDHAAAEEVAQDVFLELHKNLAALASGSHVVFWLRRTASHRSIDYVRKRKLRSAAALDDVAEPSVQPESGDPFLQRKLRALIASLPEKQRIVMVLRYQEEMTPEEIGRTLDIPVRTVKSHLQRSLVLIREKMERGSGLHGIEDVR
jgi:RNA polymerase sigma-70 factor (ECF subfamily)